MATLIAPPDLQGNDPSELPLSSLSEPSVSASSSSQPGRADGYAQMVVLCLLLASPAIICLHSAVANDPDIWWHLRTGQWILQHHAIPRVDPFSAPNAGKPWPAYSWLFEVLTYRLFARFGLTAIVGYSATMLLLITAALYRMIRRLQADFSVIALLVFGACFAMGHMFTPRPWLFTILLFVFELDILMQARRTGRTRELLWLPLIFCLWSNIHIQFIDGLAVLGLVLVESALNARGKDEPSQLGIVPAAAALAASVVATLLNPFGWHIYRIAFELATQPGVINKITELKAIPFRDATDWSVLGLTLAALVTLAWQRSQRVFDWLLVLFGAYVAFKSQRDVWVVATAAVAILAAHLPARADVKPILLPRFATLLAACVAFALLLSGFRLMHVTNAALEKQIEGTYPVKAVAAIQAKGYPGPIFNDFNWGGYLIWSLRMPVSIDGRAAFYGDTAIDRSVSTWSAETDWKSDPLLQKAALVIGPPKASLVQVLRLDPQYQLVYEDKTSVVFTAHK